MRHSHTTNYMGTCSTDTKQKLLNASPGHDIEQLRLAIKQPNNHAYESHKYETCLTTRPNKPDKQWLHPAWN